MKTKKHKKHKSERHDEEQSEKEPLRLVLKVGDSFVAHSPHRESKKHKHKKKKKKKSKDHHRHDEERPHKHRVKEETEDDMEVSQEEEEVVAPPKRVEEVESEDTEPEEEVPVPPRPQEKPVIPQTTSREDESGVLRICLKYLHKKLQVKDVNGFFAYPVNDMIAPGYSIIISHPMDFSTMMTKIDNSEYKNVLDYKKDFVLMCNNAMTYNRPETIYYKEAKRLFQISMKMMSKEKLLVMKRTLPFMASLRFEELGIDDTDDTSKAVMEAIVEEEKEQKERAKEREEIGKFEAIPDNMSAAEILSQAQAAAKDAADMLTLRQPECRFGFLRKRDDGSTSMVLMNPDNDGIVSKKERIISIGALVGKLGSGGGSLTGYREDKRNRVTPGQYLHYGPFGTYAPQYDSTFANMTKDETDLLLSTYGDETGVGYAKSVMSFVENGGDYAIAMVDNLLDILTKGEHAKTKALLEQKMNDDGSKPVVTNGSDPHRKTPDDKNNIDFDSLRSLSDLGVDMSFLDSMEKTIKKEKDPVQEKLDQTATLLNDLQQTQSERLSKNLPPHITQVPGPSEKEIQLAQKVTKELKELAQEAHPGNVASVPGLRKSMGVTFDPSETSKQTAVLPSAGTTQPANKTDRPAEQMTGNSANQMAITNSTNQIMVSGTPPVIQSANQTIISMAAPVNQPVQLLQGTTIVTGDQSHSSQTPFSTNIPNIISQHVSSSTYPVSNVSLAPTILQQSPQPQIIQPSSVMQPSSVTFQTPTIVASAAIPFQTTGNLFNQTVTVGDVPVVAQQVQNAPDLSSSAPVANNDDDSDIEMDISEFLQFPSN